MQERMRTFWTDERGTAIVSDWIFLTSILVIAILPCMVGVRERVRQSLAVGARSSTNVINCSVNENTTR